MLEDEFNQLYHQHSKLVYNVCLNYLQNAPDAEEACQNVFVKLYHKYETFKKESEVKTWIYRITINECLDQLKSKKRIRRLNFLSILDFGYEKIGTVVEFNHPGIILEEKESIEKIFKVINELSDNQKTAILLRAIEGLSQKEIADILNLSEKAVESLLSRARATLKTKLNGNEGK